MADWRRERLGDYAQIAARIGWRGLSADEYVENGPFLIAGKHIVSGAVDWASCDHLTEDRYRESPEIALQIGDVIVSKDGTIGRVARIDSLPGPATLNGTMMLVRPTGGLDHRYLSHMLSGSAFKKLVEERISGSSVPHLFQRDLVTLPVSLPPLEEQWRIAEILDTIDETIQATERVMAKLTVARVGLLREQLAPGMSDSPPPGWQVYRVEELLGHRSPAMRSGPFGSSLLASELVNGGVPLLGIDNVLREHFVADYRRFVTPDKSYELRRYRVRPGDIMITIMGTVGRCCVVPDSIGEALSSKHVWTLTLDQECYVPELACLQMNYAPWVLAHFSRDEQGGIMSAIRSETLRSLRLPTPPIAEQRRIWAMLRAPACRIEAESATLSKLRELRAGFADDLLSGRVRTVAA